MPPFERPRSGPERTPEQERRELGKQMIDQIVREQSKLWITVPMERRDANVDLLFGHGMLNRLAGFQAQAAPVVDIAQSTLTAAWGDRSSQAETELETICNALRADPPEYGDKPNGTDHRYLRLETTKPLNGPKDAEPLSLYRIQRATILRDIATLEAVKGGFPEASNLRERVAVEQLILQLQMLAPLDPQTAIRETADRVAGGKSMMDVAGKQMSRIGLIGILAAGTAIFGTIGIVNFIRKGEISAAPFLWGFATWFLADDGLRKALFGPRFQKEFQEIRTVTSNPLLQALSVKYGIGGTNWKNIVGNMYEEKKGETLRAVLRAKPPTEEEIAEAVTEIGGDGTRLGEMMRTIDRPSGKTHFQILHAALSGATKDEARTFIEDFVERDCVRTAPMLDPAVGKALKTLEKGMKP